MLHSQIKNLSVPAGSHLNRVRVFSSLDNQLALNVFSFDNTTSTKQSATRADGPHIIEYINEIKAGEITPQTAFDLQHSCSYSFITISFHILITLSYFHAIERQAFA